MNDEIRDLHRTILRLESIYANEFDALKKAEIKRFIESFKIVLSEK